MKKKADKYEPDFVKRNLDYLCSEGEYFRGAHSTCCIHLRVQAVGTNPLDQQRTPQQLVSVDGCGVLSRSQGPI